MKRNAIKKLFTLNDVHVNSAEVEYEGFFNKALINKQGATTDMHTCLINEKCTHYSISEHPRQISRRLCTLHSFTVVFSR